MTHGRPTGRMSLKTRTILILATLVSLVVGVSDAVRLWRGAVDREAGLAARAEQVAVIQAEALVQPLWDLDNGQIANVLQALSRDPDFLAARVVDPAGKLVVAQGQVPATAAVIAVQVEIRRAEKTIGRLILTLNKAGLDRAFNTDLLLALVNWAALLLSRRSTVRTRLVRWRRPSRYCAATASTGSNCNAPQKKAAGARTKRANAIAATRPSVKPPNAWRRKKPGKPRPGGIGNGKQPNCRSARPSARARSPWQPSVPPAPRH